MEAQQAPVSITPLILSGGAGSRLWPLSTADRPKQFHALAGEQTMFAATLARVLPGADCHFTAPMVVCGTSHQKLIAGELASMGLGDATLVLEPVARNTAPALAAAAVLAAARDPDALILVLPADHVISRPEALRAACVRAAPAALAGRIVTFGIVPTGPETGYGYIQRGAALSEGVYAVEAFREKPDAATASAYIASGQYSWNAGIFLYRASALIEEMAQHAPQVLAAARAAVAGGQSVGHGGLALDQAAFEQAPSISIDYAVMERTSHAAIVPVDMGWSDVGSFSTLWELGDKDAHDNCLSGQAMVFDSARCLVRSSTVPVAVIGLDNIMVISTPTGILVAPLARAQDVRLAADAAKKL